MNSYRHWIGPWTYQLAGEKPEGWHLPDSVMWSIDLRGLADPDGLNVAFAVTDPEADLSGDGFYQLGGTSPGDAQLMPLAPGDQLAWEGQTGQDIPEAETVWELVLYQLSFYADATYERPTPPVTGTTKQKLEVRCGPYLSITDIPSPAQARTTAAGWFKIPGTYQRYQDRLLMVLRDQLGREIDANGKDDPAHRKHLGELASRYKMSWKQILTRGQQRGHSGPLPHNTTFSDDLYRGSVTQLNLVPPWGPAASGALWNHVINSGDGGATMWTGDSSRRLVRWGTAFASDNHQCQIQRTTQNNGTVEPGPAVRIDEVAVNDGYKFSQYTDTGYLTKIVGGALTHIGPTTSFQITGLDWLGVSADGSTIIAYAGQGYTDERINVTDTSISSNLYAGMHMAGQYTAEPGQIGYWESQDAGAVFQAAWAHNSVMG